MQPERILQVQMKPLQGFTLAEVMVGILVIATFVGVAMQTFVAGTSLRVKAQSKSEAMTWIQEDVESIRHQASQLGSEPARCTATSVTDGYGDKLRDKVLGIDSAAPIDQQDIPYRSSLGNRAYTLTRVMRVREVAPFDVLTLNYSVTESDETIAAQLYTEVLPDATFSCF
jgi:prepilin-type N-terminal cleavage/methylation domain-containing protein